LDNFECEGGDVIGPNFCYLADLLNSFLKHASRNALARILRDKDIVILRRL